MEEVAHFLQANGQPIEVSVKNTTVASQDAPETTNVKNWYVSIGFAI